LPVLHSFPTRRSSDLGFGDDGAARSTALKVEDLHHRCYAASDDFGNERRWLEWMAADNDRIDGMERVMDEPAEFYCDSVNFEVGDRKSTRLNSSHVAI